MTVKGWAVVDSVEPGGKRGQDATIRMGNGAMFHAVTSVDGGLEMIEAATAPPPVKRGRPPKETT